MNQEKPDYLLIADNDITKFNAKLKEHIALGYYPFMGHAVCVDMYQQLQYSQQLHKPAPLAKNIEAEVHKAIFDKVSNLTKKQALLFARAGFQISHRYFTDKEYLEYKDEVLVTEEGYKVTDEFWGLKTGEQWNTDWFIYLAPRQED